MRHAHCAYRRAENIYSDTQGTIFVVDKYEPHDFRQFGNERSIIATSGCNTSIGGGLDMTRILSLSPMPLRTIDHT